MNGVWKDFQFGLRLLVKQPGFTIVALIALGLGIGATSAIFSIVNSVILRPLPYNEPSRLITIWEDHRGLGGPAAEYTSPTGFEDWRDQTRSFSHVAAYSGWSPTFSGSETPEQLVGATVSHDIFSVLDVKPRYGRAFRPEDDRRGSENVAVISHELWQRRFQGDAQAVGRSVILNGESYTLIGVMPQGFKFPVIEDAEIWRTIQPGLGEGCRRGCLVLRVLARLKPGISIEAARDELTALARRIEKEFPETNSKIGFSLIPLHDFLIGDVRTPMLVMFGAILLVLLIACANVANLMLARSAARNRELSIRAALGAGRGRIIRQLLIESLSLALIGGFIGLLISIWLVDLLVGLSPDGLPRAGEIRVDFWVFIFTAGIAILSGILSGLAPIIRISHFDLNSSLKDGGTGMPASGKSRRILNFLVAAEIAISLLLLIGAGLLLKSFIKLKSVDTGFNPQRVLTMNVLFPPARYPERADIKSVTDRVVEGIGTIPGVEAAGAVSSLPLGGANTDASFFVEGRPAPPPNREPVAWYSLVSPDYFKSMGMRIIRGRPIEATDLENSPTVVVINETMANRYFPNEDPIGRRIGNGGPDGWRTIVGIAADIRHFGIDQVARPSMFLPLSQVPSRRLFLTVRSSTDPASIVPPVRRILASIDPQLAPANLTTMEEIASESLSLQRFTLLLIGIFATLALILAAAGIYGVMSFAVTQRTREIGIRMALGAQSQSIIKMIISQGMLVALFGVLFGLVGAFGLTRLMSSLLFEVSEIDPVTFVAVALLMLIIAFPACLIPARRAVVVDPLITLRYE
ncbi:MAG: ABC transporter permease [Acidobacteria bacterium]|nr:ABC transporter permease [Acidobacteriota bacterium]